jgi:hypothetical protein
VPQPGRISKTTPLPAAGQELDRIFLLLKASVEEIHRDHPDFFGTLKIEVNFREGQIETVALDRRQTFKY